MKKRHIPLVLLSASLWGQHPLSLKDAVGLAFTRNQSIAASTAGQHEAALKIDEARSGFLPKLNYSESWARSNNPVFVFSSLLT